MILGLADTSCREMIGAVMRHLPVDVYATDDGAEVLNRVTTLCSVDQDVALLVLGLQLKTFSGAQILSMVRDTANVRQTIVLATSSEDGVLERIELGPETVVAPLEHASVELVIDCLTGILENPTAPAAPAKKPACPAADEPVGEYEETIDVEELCSTCGITIDLGMGRFRTPKGTYCVCCHASPLSARTRMATY